MNAQHVAQSAYRTAGQNIRSPQRTEYEAIATVTHRLKAAAQAGPKRFPDLAEALHQNRRLWCLLAGEVADKTNGLPKSLRARIFYLAEFTELHTVKVLTGEADIRPLLDINTAILRGLRSGGAGT